MLEMTLNWEAAVTKQVILMAAMRSWAMLLEMRFGNAELFQSRRVWLPGKWQLNLVCLEPTVKPAITIYSHLDNKTGTSQLKKKRKQATKVKGR